MTGRFHFGQTIATAVLLFLAATCLYATPHFSFESFDAAVASIALDRPHAVAADGVRSHSRLRTPSARPNPHPRCSLAAGSPLLVLRAPELRPSILRNSPARPLFGRTGSQPSNRAPPLV